ncbi:ABC transporter ATP-binding protein [Bacillus sp. SD088]|uniref:ABC transporter ATP-binding protein n=1 Tax=Bacillus sp. SD088 TaxID=2782012 RepID=UPI001A961AD1|nr:ABC transporter ATP-binding protein [Bacillus sp. SD088]MBO0992721.1 ABC transporter ATP-binding protein [Bacillus sp. SD088]
MSVFSIEHLSKTYQSGAETTTTLRDINLTINSNEFICIIGPSGCGKSTLLEILGGLRTVSAGEVHFQGKPLEKPSKRIGVIFQDASLYPWRTIEQNVGIGLEMRGVKKKDRREAIHSYLDMVGLNGFATNYPHQLSGGMKQRAGIARALVNDPDVLLMDEPFGALDHLTRLSMQDDLLQIWSKEKKTVVFVTHDVAEAVFLADRVVLMSPRPGKVKEIFSIKQQRPRNRDDEQLLKLQSKIYESINRAKEKIMPEYSI